MKEKAPKGGWLPPPGNTERLKPLATAVPGGKKGWKWKENKLTAKEERDHKRFQRAMREADEEGRTSFEW